MNKILMLRKLGGSQREKGEEVWESKEGLAQLHYVHFRKIHYI